MSGTTINALHFIESSIESSHQSRPYIVIDMRTASEFQAEHLTDSYNMPLDQLDEKACENLLDTSRDKTVYLLCGIGVRAQKAQQKLHSFGHSAIVIEGGLKHLKQHKVSLVHSGHNVMSLERQVRIAAGALVVLGASLSVLISLPFVAISAFVGAGLIFSGVTDSCGMAMMLSRMPWNRKAA